jgi:hypothetical protein
MLICKKCGHNFPSKAFINGKYRSLRTRKYCLTCSPFGEGNNRKLEIPRKDRSKRYLEKKYRKCTICGKMAYIPVISSRCGTCRGKIRRNGHKVRAIELLGGKCCICGYKKCFGALDFHHVNPEEKEFSLSTKWHWSWDRLEKEIKKCILICNRCHVEMHSGIIKYSK